jgi:hypothetical protein
VWQWVADNYVLLTWLGSAAVAILVAFIVLLPIAIVRIPPDHFIRMRTHPPRAKCKQSFPRTMLRVLRNLTGAVFLVSGLVMLALPAPGMATIVIGLMLLEFPGKHRLLIWIIQRRWVHLPINWIRNRRRCSPLQIPPRTA